MREIEIQTVGRIRIPDEWDDAKIKKYIKELAVRPNAAATPQPAQNPPQGSRVLGVVTVDANNWTVTGDLENLSPELVKLLLIRWENEFWHVHPKDVVELERVLQERNYRFQLLTPPSFPASGRLRPLHFRPLNVDCRQPVSSTVTGIVDRVTRELRGNKELGHITLAVYKKRPAFGCWDKDINDILAAAVGKSVVVQVVSRAGYSNIVGLVRVSNQTYTDGKIPDVQQKDREPGRTLFP